MRHLLPLAILLTTLSACAPGLQGEAGPAGAPGSAGPAGEDGADGLTPGDRLVPRVYLGADGSKMPTGDALDTEREEVCKPTLHEGEVLCLPAMLDATPFNTWADAACSQPAFVARYTPAAHPEGSSLVLVHGGPLDGELLMRAEEVPAIWTDGSGQPCQPYTPSDGFPPPYFHWAPFDAEAFVALTAVPAP